MCLIQILQIQILKNILLSAHTGYVHVINTKDQCATTEATGSIGVWFATGS